MSVAKVTEIIASSNKGFDDAIAKGIRRANKTLKNIKRWKIIADSGVKATIEEEVMEAGFWLDKELKRLGLERNYNQFFYYLSAFDEIQQSGLADATRDQYYSAMRDLGQSQCRAMKSQLTPQSHFLYDSYIIRVTPYAL